MGVFLILTSDSKPLECILQGLGAGHGLIAVPFLPHSCVRRRAAWCSVKGPAVEPSTSPALDSPGGQKGGSLAVNVLQASSVVAFK